MKKYGHEGLQNESDKMMWSRGCDIGSAMVRYGDACSTTRRKTYAGAEARERWAVWNEESVNSEIASSETFLGNYASSMDSTSESKRMSSPRGRTALSIPLASLPSVPLAVENKRRAAGDASCPTEEGAEAARGGVQPWILLKRLRPPATAAGEEVGVAPTPVAAAVIDVAGSIGEGDEVCVPGVCSETGRELGGGVRNIALVLEVEGMAGGRTVRGTATAS